MTNEEAIYELSVNVDYKTPQIKEACQMAIEELQQQPKKGWIPVSERLPEERKTISGPDTFIDPSELVLVQMKSGWMHVTRYWGSRERYKDCPWIDLYYPTTDEVIAWMPLPERYKEGE